MTGDSSSVGADLLTTVLAATRRIVEVRRQHEDIGALARRAEGCTSRPGVFRHALERTDRVNIIAECKRRSPSRGVLRREYDPVEIARSYEAAGAAAISVLTEPTFFDGALEHLRAVREAVSAPVIRKDFVVCEYQLLEARAAGADGVLLIVAALAPRALRDLVRRARTLGLDPLVEVHTVEELSVAVDAGAEIIGVNNRNLRTLRVDVRASETIVAKVPRGVVAVSESGLKTADDLRGLAALGYRAFLIGERFITDPQPGTALRHLLDSVMATGTWRE